MGSKSRERIYGGSVRASAERAAEARKVADRLACEAWNQRMLGFRGPAQPSPTLGDALNAGYLYLDATLIRRSRSMWCDGRRRRRSTSWSATCAVRTVRRYGAILTNGAIWSHCGRTRFPRPTRHRIGGRASANRADQFVSGSSAQVCSQNALDCELIVWQLLCNLCARRG